MMEPNKAKKSFIRHPSWIKVDKKKNLIALICWIIVISELMTNLILQCVYLTLQGHSRGNPGKFKAQIEWIESSMVNVGQIHRADGATGIFFYAICVAYILIYSLLEFISGGEMFTKNEILLFMVRPDENGRFVSQRIQNCLDSLISSNKNFTKKFIIHIKSRNPNLNSRFSIENSQLINQNVKSNETIIDLYISRSLSSKITDSFNVEQELERKCTLVELNGEEEPIDFAMLNAEIELSEALFKQRQFLSRLKSNVARVWPPSKNKRMINKLKNTGLFTYIAYSVVGWFIGQFIAILTNHMAYTSVLASSRLSHGFGNFTLTDRLSCFKVHIIAYFIMLSFVPHFCVFFVTIFYQLEQLRNLWSLADKFYENLRRCELWQEKSDRTYSTGSGCLLNKQSRRDLKFECDKSIIELYINYYILRQEVKSAVKIFKGAAGQVASCVIITLFPVFVYFEYIPNTHWRTLIIIVMFMVMFSDFSFLICAFFDSACNRFAKHTVSILAFLEAHNYKLYLSSKSSSQTYIFKKNSIEDETYQLKMFLPKLWKSEGQPDYIYYSKSFITPHSTILWHKLLNSHDAVSEGFVIKLYGLYKINYSGALKLNHWLVWIFLVTLLYQ